MLDKQICLDTGVVWGMGKENEERHQEVVCYRARSRLGRLIERREGRVEI